MDKQTAMERILKARESRSVDQLAEQVEPLAKALAVLGQGTMETLEALVKEAESQHEILSDSMRQGREVLSSRIAEIERAAKKMTSAAKRISWQIVAVAVAVGLIIGIAAGAGSWIMLKDHYIRSKAFETWKPQDAQQVIDALLQ